MSTKSKTAHVAFPVDAIAGDASPVALVKQVDPPIDFRQAYAKYLQRVAPPPADLLDAILDGTEDAVLVELGRRIQTSRVLTDTTRIYGGVLDFMEQATPPQLQRLRGVSMELVALAVYQGASLEELLSAMEHREATTSAARMQTGAAAAKSMSDGKMTRDQAEDVLRGAAARRPDLVMEVNAAVGTAETPAALALGLKGLAGVLRKWLGLSDPKMVARLRVANLDREYAVELEAAAGRVMSTEGATQAPAVPTDVTQGQIDRAEGINLLLLGRILRAFGQAHKKDGTIPRFHAIATRRIFQRAPKKKVPKVPKASPPAQTAAAAPAQSASAPVAAASPRPVGTVLPIGPRAAASG